MFPKQKPSLCQKVFGLPHLQQVEVGKVDGDDRKGKADEEDSRNCAQTSNKFPQTCQWRYVSIANRGHCDDRPPDGVVHVLEDGVFFILLNDKDNRSKHKSRNKEEKEEKSELHVNCLKNMVFI